MKLWGMVFAVVAAVFLGPQVQAVAVTDRVVINEVMANPATGEVEWIELYNPTDAAISMSGWRLVVTSGNFSGVFASDAIIAARGYVVRKASDTTSKLHNTSATITLKPSASGATIDEVTYAGIAQAKSYARTCDAADTWVAQTEPTQGTANCAVMVPPPPPKDITPPTIDDIVQSELTKTVELAVRAHDETAMATLTAAMTHYGTEVARCEGTETCSLRLDTTTLPNGPATLEVTAIDQAGNRTVKSVTLTIANTITVTPPADQPHSEPTVSKPSEPLPTATPAPTTPSIDAYLPTLEVAPPMQQIATVTTGGRGGAMPTVAIARTAVAAVSPPVAVLPVKTSTQNRDVTDQPFRTIALESENSSGGSSHTTPSVTMKTHYTEYVATIVAVIIAACSFALWRYLRRTKP